MSQTKSNIPRELREHGIAAVHQWPQCANEDSHIVGRFDSEYAWNHFAKIELNPPHLYVGIALDCDTPSESGWPGGKPSVAPSWLVINTREATPERRAGGIHCVFSLELPVARHDAARTLPLAFLSHIADRLSYHLGADPDYAGVLTRNPVSPGEGCFVHWGRMLPYSLNELDKLLPKGKPPKRRLSGIGRNCDLFRAMLSEVFRPKWANLLLAQGWTGASLDHVRAQNYAMFAPDGLPDGECRSIAKSCWKYWTRHYSPGRFSEIQRERNGKRWHGDFGYAFDKQAEDVKQLRAWGLKQATIAAVAGLSQSQVSRILSQKLFI